MATTPASISAFYPQRRKIIWATTPANNDEVVFILNRDQVPAGLHLSGDASDTYVLKSLVTDTNDSDASTGSGTFTEVKTDSTTFSFSATTSVRTIEAAGVYKLVAPASVTGAVNAILCW